MVVQYEIASKEVLDALTNIKGQTARRDTPILRNLLLVEHYLLQPHHSAVAEDKELFALDTILCELVLVEYNALRRLHSLRDVTEELPVDTLLECVQQDFTQGALLLTSLSLIYHCYISIAVDLSLEELADYGGISPRTARRYRGFGVNFLRNRLILQENALIADRRKLYLARNLPYITRTFVGRQQEMQSLLKALRSARAMKVAVVGQPHIGKTTFVAKTLKNLLDDKKPPMDMLLWMDIDEVLGRVDEIQRYAALYNLWLVINHFEPSQFSMLVQELKDATLIVICEASDTRLLVDFDLVVPVRPLQADDAQDLFSRRLESDYVFYAPDQLIELTQGSPAEIRMLADSFKFNQDHPLTVNQRVLLWFLARKRAIPLDPLQLHLPYLVDDKSLKSLFRAKFLKSDEQNSLLCQTNWRSHWPVPDFTEVIHDILSIRDVLALQSIYFGLLIELINAGYVTLDGERRHMMMGFCRWLLENYIDTSIVDCARFINVCYTKTDIRYGAYPYIDLLHVIRLHTSGRVTSTHIILEAASESIEEDDWLLHGLITQQKAVAHRLHAQYELSLQTIEHYLKKTPSHVEFRAFCILERVQIALDLGDGTDALRYLKLVDWQHLPSRLKAVAYCAMMQAEIVLNDVTIEESELSKLLNSEHVSVRVRARMLQGHIHYQIGETRLALQNYRLAYETIMTFHARHPVLEARILSNMSACCIRIAERDDASRYLREANHRLNNLRDYAGQLQIENLQLLKDSLS